MAVIRLETWSSTAIRLEMYTDKFQMQSDKFQTKRKMELLIMNLEVEATSPPDAHSRPFCKKKFATRTLVLIAIRGARGKGSRSWQEDTLSNISFNLIPYVKTYEG